MEMDYKHLDQIGERIGILKGMRRVGVEEATTVGAHFFDDLLGGDRPLGNCLGRAIQGVHDRVGVEVLDDSL